MIKVRRVHQRMPIGRKYEIEYRPLGAAGGGWTRATRAAVKVLEPLVGVGDAWSFTKAADDAWQRGDHGWAVEFEERGCAFCRDSRERSTEMQQLAEKPDSSDLLLRCPRCSTLWDCAAYGRDDVPISPRDARRLFPGTDIQEL